MSLWFLLMYWCNNLLIMVVVGLYVKFSDLVYLMISILAW